MCEVSVLMPVYNAEKYLAEAIDSIISQEFTGWELIIIDDGSTDNSEAIIRGYADARIKYARNEENMGLVYTRNRLIAMSSGQYVAFLDSDDVSMPQRLSEQVSFLDNNPEYALCGTWSTMINKKSETIKKIKLPVHDNELKCALLFASTFVQSSIMVRKEILVDYGYNREYPLAEDYELWCRISKRWKLKNVPKLLTKYRWHDFNISKSRKEHLDTLVKNIYKRELKEIGIDASDEELDIHSTIRDKSLQTDANRIYLQKLRQWLKRLQTKQSGVSMFKQDNIFAATILFRWILACKERSAYVNALNFPFPPNIQTLFILTGMLYRRL